MKNLILFLFSIFIFTNYSFPQNKIIDGSKSLICSYDISPDSKLIAFNQDKAIKFYDIKKNNISKIIPLSEWGTKILRFSPDGKYLAWINAGGNNDEIFLYDLDKNTINSVKISCRDFKFSPVGNLIVTCSDNNPFQFKLIDIKSKTVLKSIRNNNDNTYFNLSYDGSKLLVANRSYINTCSFLPKVDCQSIDETVFLTPKLKYSYNNTYVVIYEHHTLIWNPDANAKTKIFNNPNIYGDTKVCCFSPLDQYLLCYSTRNERIDIFSLDGTLFNKIEIKEYLDDITFSSDGKYIIYNGDDAIKLLESSKYLPYTKLYTKYYNSFYKDYQNELKTVFEKSKTRDEFETEDEYYIRIEDAFALKKSIDDKYYNLIYNSVNENIAQQNTEIDKKNAEVQEEINKSIELVETKISSVGTYDINNELLPVTINGVTENVRIKRDDAKSLKNNFSSAVVKGKKRLKYDLKNYEYFELIIIHPISKNEYKFGNW